MALKNVLVALVGAALLAWSGPSVADEYRASEFLRLDLSSAVLSPKPLGPAASFVPGPLDVTITFPEGGIASPTDLGSVALGSSTTSTDPGGCPTHASRIQSRM